MFRTFLQPLILKNGVRKSNRKINNVIPPQQDVHVEEFHIIQKARFLIENMLPDLHIIYIIINLDR